ncbi:PREDICTED: uncharacterized protein LOC109177640 [Ipomoea nil]|uniref:uncharacterized protein LOC109177640 n=1 Tax=Ipomoea nil TaxID=35883 RepID=UPI0009009585|nr:PREDICTED: uncharacterized protein LOC109177640 [Ipomoea nil]
MEIELGHTVNRSELWMDTHKVKRGSSVNEECRIITEKIRNEMDQCSPSQSQFVSQDDPVGKTFGKEHNGRVRGLGFGPCPSKFKVISCKFKVICKRPWEGLLLLFWKELLAKFLKNLLSSLTKHLNQYPMKEASYNLHKGVESKIHPLVIMLMDNLLHDMQLFCSFWAM